MRDGVPTSNGSPAEALRWRVAPGLPGLKLAGVAAFAVLGVFFAGDPVRLMLVGAAGLALAAWAVRDLVAPVRLAADAAGVTIVTGYAAHRLLPWERIERIRVDSRARLGLRSETLEIDTGDSLHLLSPYDLGAPPADVAARLHQLRAHLHGG